MVQFWVDQNSGYIATEQVSPSFKPLKVDSESSEFDALKNQDSSFKTCFLNCGGTIVSLPRVKYDLNTETITGVNPVKNLVSVNERVRKDLFDIGCAYEDHITKLSEDWSLEDYFSLDLKLQELSKNYRNIIISHGTDYISYFAAWVAIHGWKYNSKIIILIGQRSLDRPTAELPLLLKKVNLIFSKMNLRSTVVLTQKTPKIIKIHNPFEIRKFHTTKQDGFYSSNEIRLSLTENLDNLKSKLKMQETKLKYNFKKKFSPLELKVENPLIERTSDSNECIFLSRGVGNIRRSTTGSGYMGTIVGAGPTNAHLYAKRDAAQSQIKKIDSITDFTWEALHVLTSLIDLK